MRNYTSFYIDGQWVEPAEPMRLDVVNPATEAVAGVISLGSRADVDKAVSAAKRAFETYSQTTREERLALLDRIIAVYQRRLDDMAQAISEEMGAPIATVAKPLQAPAGLGHFQVAREVLAGFDFEKEQGTTRFVREPVGVCALITPWNWPANQIACKVAPALAAGCTMVLKPSEIAPLSGHITAEILHEAGVPRGVFNLVNVCASGRRHGVVHGFDARRNSRRQGRRGHGQESRARARRQVAECHPRRGAARGGRHPRRAADDEQHRPEL
jgi:acyl-CoA reductase-like NAD-dependent aldehyde dehydrogenase